MTGMLPPVLHSFLHYRIHSPFTQFVSFWWKSSPFIRWGKFWGTTQTQKHADSGRCSKLTLCKQYYPLRRLAEISPFFPEKFFQLSTTLGRFTVQWRVVALLWLLFWRLSYYKLLGATNIYDADDMFFFSPNATTYSYELSWFPSWLWR